jgi:CheY-like chemotaxis protein
MLHTLLLADDSVTVQRVVELTFAEEGFGVISVGTGAQAIERIEKDRPDIVLVDVNMPEGDGYEVAAHVKATPDLKHIPVVLMTGAFEQVDESRAMPAGYDAVLAKPFEPHMVIALVRDLLSRRAEEAHGELPPREAKDAAPAEARAAERPAAPASGFPFDPGASVGSPTPSLDDYFDRLDEALASVPPFAARPAPPPRPVGPLPEATSALGSAPAAAPAAAGPSLADAFSALLEDELGQAAPADAAAQPSAPSAPPATPAASASAAPAAGFSDELVEAVTRRVVERLSERAVRDLVASTVLDVTERLVREEIERIKASA